MRLSYRFTRATILLAAVVLAPPGKAAAQAQNSEFAAEMAKADAAMQAEAYDDALISYRRASSRAKNKSPQALYGVARAHLALGAHKPAIDACTDALEHVGDDREMQAHIHNLRGIALVQLSTKPDDKRLPQAEADFRRALELVPELRAIYYNLRLALLKMGRDEEGVSEMKAFLTRDPNGSSAAEARRMIANPRRARELYAPDFSFVALDGQKLSLQDLRGKTVLLDFWGTWCPPCRAATPALVRLAKKYGDRQFVIVGISSDKSEQIVADYVATNAMRWPQYVDLKRTLHRAYTSPCFPPTSWSITRA